MKRFLPTFLLFWTAAFSLVAQIQSYYDDVNLNLTGNDLRDELATKIIATHTHNPSYNDLWQVYRHTDSAAPGRIYLIYGWEEGRDSDCHNDLTRDADDSGGSASACEYNREHVYPKSLGDPNLGTSGPGSDAHHVRPSDVSMNSWRGNKKFADDSGHAHAIDSDTWYPGDRWKGDVARIIMYLYLRYGSQCLPSRVGTGPSVATDSDMLQLFLQWNAEDPPSPVEDLRNDYLEGYQGNRNPFIDNPYLATLIWGGPDAQDRWNMDVPQTDWMREVSVWPNPAEEVLHIHSDLDVPVHYELTDSEGQLIFSGDCRRDVERDTSRLAAGIYFLIMTTPASSAVRRIIKK